MNSNFGVDPNLLNEFAYTIGSPLMNIDPTGMDTCPNTTGKDKESLKKATELAKTIVNEIKHPIQTRIGQFFNWCNGLGWISDSEVPAKLAWMKANKPNRYWAHMMAQRVVNDPMLMNMCMMGSGIKIVGPLSDSALVLRGGTCDAVRFSKGSGVVVEGNGTLSGVSVNSANGLTASELSAGIPNKQVGTTTVGAVRALGGEVTSSPTSSNPLHATMDGITAEQAEGLMKPTIPNPSID